MPPFKTTFPKMIGVIHLGALPGSPQSPDNHPDQIIHHVGYKAIQEAKALVKAGFDGLIIENFGDFPFFKDEVPPETIAAMSIIAAALRDFVKVPVGINVLRNDTRSALSIASCSGCDFIRSNFISGVAASDQGLIEGKAAEVIRERRRLNSRTRIFADVLVKHSQSLSQKNIEVALEETVLRSMADAVILTGSTTGRPVDLEQLKEANQITKRLKVPLYIGSGLDSANAQELLEFTHGAIVGSAFRRGKKAGAPIDSKNLKALFASLKKRKKLRKKKNKVKKQKG